MKQVHEALQRTVRGHSEFAEEFASLPLPVLVKWHPAAFNKHACMVRPRVRFGDKFCKHYSEFLKVAFGLAGD